MEGVNMAKKKQTIVSLDKDQIEWLEGKVEEGYSKSGLIRYAVKRLMTEPTLHKEEKVAELTVDDAIEPDEPIKTVEIDKILEVLIMEVESGKMDDCNLPKNTVEVVRHMQQQFKDIDHLYPMAAFELGKFKGEMETRFNQALQRIRDNAKSQS